MTTRERMLGGLWGAVVGDALGVPVEFTTRARCRRDPVRDMRGFGSHHQPPGTWSDDSSLLLCTAEALCEAYDADALARRFVRWSTDGYWAAHGTVFDIGGATSAALSRIRRGIPAEQAGGIADADNGNGNGSLMRILPVAHRYAGAPAAELLAMAHRVSALTHRHPRAQMSCGIYCLLARELLNGAAPADALAAVIPVARQAYAAAPFADEAMHFLRILRGTLGDLPEPEISSGGYVVHTLEAAIWCLLTTASFEDAVLTAVNLGGDTDTTGCVAGGLAGIRYGLAAIPEDWLAVLARHEEIAALFARFTDVEKLTDSHTPSQRGGQHGE